MGENDEEMRQRVLSLREEGTIPIGSVIQKILLRYREGLQEFVTALSQIDTTQEEEEEIELTKNLFPCFVPLIWEIEDQLLLQWLVSNVFRYDCEPTDGYSILMLFLLEIYLKDHDSPFSMIEAFEFYLHKESYQELFVLLEGSTASKILEEEKSFIIDDIPQKKGDQRHLLALYLSLINLCLNKLF